MTCLNYPICATIDEQLLYFTIILQLGFDVFNALDLMDNKEFLEKLKFGVGDGNLQYYIYNWKCAQMPAEKVRKHMSVFSSGLL